MILNDHPIGKIPKFQKKKKQKINEIQNVNSDEVLEFPTKRGQTKALLVEICVEIPKNVLKNVERTLF